MKFRVDSPEGNNLKEKSNFNEKKFFRHFINSSDTKKDQFVRRKHTNPGNLTNYRKIIKKYDIPIKSHEISR